LIFIQANLLAGQTKSVLASEVRFAIVADAVAITSPSRQTEEPRGNLSSGRYIARMRRQRITSFH
jgi:hypothetical protein